MGEERLERGGAPTTGKAVKVAREVFEEPEFAALG